MNENMVLNSMKKFIENIIQNLRHIRMLNLDEEFDLDEKECSKKYK